MYEDACDCNMCILTCHYQLCLSQLQACNFWFWSVILSFSVLQRSPGLASILVDLLPNLSTLSQMTCQMMMMTVPKSKRPSVSYINISRETLHTEKQVSTRAVHAWSNIVQHRKSDSIADLNHEPITVNASNVIKNVEIITTL